MPKQGGLLPKAGLKPGTSYFNAEVVLARQF